MRKYRKTAKLIYILIKTNKVCPAFYRLHVKMVKAGLTTHKKSDEKEAIWLMGKLIINLVNQAYLAWALLMWGLTNSKTM